MNPLKFIPESWKEKLKVRSGAITLGQRLGNLRRAGFLPKQIIDAGAFRGDWARVALRVFPEARVLMVEPQEDCQSELRSLMQSDGRLGLCQTLLGASNGEQSFLIEGTNSRIVEGDWTPGPAARIEKHRMSRLEDAARDSGFGRAEFIKLDLQGHELEALEGAGDLFGRCEVFMVEVSWLRIGEVPLMHEVLHKFVEKGYRPYDICGHNYRPRDGALWQSDIIFVHEDSLLVSSREWA
jgi:FkbM family methyltransferase